MIGYHDQLPPLRGSTASVVIVASATATEGVCGGEPSVELSEANRIGIRIETPCSSSCSSMAPEKIKPAKPKMPFYMGVKKHNWKRR